MKKWKYKFEMYRYFEKNFQDLLAKAREIPKKVGMPSELQGNIGLTGAVSSCHGLLLKEISDRIESGTRKVIENSVLDEEIRKIVKSVYGDEWDAAAINTCEAALLVTFDALFSPPFQGRGTNYRARYIAPYEKHLHHQGGYGRPFPPRYKDIFADRGCTAGEYGFYGKRLENLDAIYVRLEGASYEPHGIKYHPTPLLSKVDTEKTLEKVREVARQHAPFLTGITSLSYDTPGYGYHDRDEDGTPRLQKGYAKIAHEFGVPYVGDNAWGNPFIGTDPRKVDADIMMYSMDKAAGGPTVGLIIGKEEPMVQIRRALGIHGERWGTGASHGKSAYVSLDPGKEALTGLIATLEILRDKPELITGPVDALYDIVVEEFAALGHHRERFNIFKSYNGSAVEVNYEREWLEKGWGLPLFPIEDMYAGCNILQTGMKAMGIVPTLAYDGNIFITPGLGTVDEYGNLLEKPTRIIIKCLVELIKLVIETAEG